MNAMRTSIIAAMLTAAGIYTVPTETSAMALEASGAGCAFAEEASPALYAAWSVPAPHGGSVPQQSSGILDRFIAELSSSSAAFDYEYVLDNAKVKMTGSGNVVLQGSSFIMKGDGLEVYCDGSVKWTIDRNASEAVAESFDREHPDYLANPALIVGDVSRVFSVVSENSSSFGGKSVIALHLAPLPGLKGISSAVLYLSGAETPVPAGLEMKMDDGIILTLTVTSFALTSRTDSSSFSFDGKTLPSDFIVTDLR